MNELKTKPIWVTWKHKADGGKLPISVITGRETGTNPSHSHEWVEFDELSRSDAERIGFIIPEGYFFLDIDHRDTQSDLVHILLKQFPTYAEMSPSGNGIHIYGKCDLSRLEKQLELYVGGLTNRYSTFTGKRISDSETVSDCTVPLLRFLECYMRKKELPSTLDPEQEDKFIKLTEEDVPQVLSDLRSQKNGSKFISLFDKGMIPDGKTPSEADVALCALIAFRVGPDPEMIDRIFRQSELYREKWDRDDYSQRTIDAGIAACHDTFHFSVIRKPPFVVERKGHLVVSPTELGEYVEKHQHYLAVEESLEFRRMYVYHNGVYRPVSREGFTGMVRGFVKDYDYHLVKMSAINETVTALYTTRRAITNALLNSNETYVNLQNGLLDIETMELLPHDHKVYSTIQLPFSFEPKNTRTDVFDAYINSLADGKEDKIRFLLEFMGAIFSNVPGYEMKKALFMYGPGNSGKSQLKKLVEKILGYENCAAIDLKQMEARFGSSSIYGKRMAGSADMSFMTIGELNIFKQATGGDAIHAEFKGKDKFWFTYKGLLWFCMNQLPKFGGDDGKWVYDRIIPFLCPNIIPENKRDPRLMEKMFEERSAIFNKAITAYRDVLLNNGNRFHEPEEAEHIRKSYMADNNSAIEFFTTMMKRRTETIKKDDPSKIDAIFSVYCEWYSEQKYPSRYAKNKKEFYESIAGFVGEDYADMKKRLHSGWYLKDYELTDEGVRRVPLVG